MSNLTNKIVTPSTAIIEQLAGELAAVWYQTALSSGYEDKKYGKNIRKFARENIEAFVPYAIKHCMEMLNNPSFDQNAKMMIYEALMKRTNDEEMRKLFPSPTKNDMHLNNFELPKNFMENHFPELLDEKYRKKKVN